MLTRWTEKHPDFLNSAAPSRDSSSGGFSLTDGDTWAWSSYDLGETQWNNLVGGRTTSLVCVKDDLKRADLLYLVWSASQEEQRHPCLPMFLHKTGLYISWSGWLVWVYTFLCWNSLFWRRPLIMPFEFSIEANWQYIDFTPPSGKAAPLLIQSRLNIPLMIMSLLCHQDQIWRMSEFSVTEVLLLSASWNQLFITKLARTRRQN